MSLRERRLSESQYKAITQANKPTSVNAFATLADLGGTTKVYKAILSQPSPESGPVIASVIQDDFGIADPIFTRVSKGVYTFPFPGVDQLTTLFTGQASITTFSAPGAGGRVQTSKSFNYGITGVDSLFINTWDSFALYELIDSAFDGVNSYIHIEVKIP